MKIRRILLFITVTVIFLSCFLIVNSKYDRLSRYPYEDEEARELIDRYLSDEEIEYIIDYSIAPNDFIRYVCDDFNIYHVESYEKARIYMWYASDVNIVQLVELIYSTKKDDEIDYNISMLKYYNYDEMTAYLKDKDGFFENKKLKEKPGEVTESLSVGYTLAAYEPRNLVSDEEITLEKDAYEAFYKAIDELEEEFKEKEVNKIIIGKSYLSYEELKEANKENNAVIPGENIHMTGRCVDLDLSDSIFLSDARYVRMKEIFNNVGFTFESCEFSDVHIVYTGALS